MRKWSTSWFLSDTHELIMSEQPALQQTETLPLCLDFSFFSIFIIACSLLVFSACDDWRWTGLSRSVRRCAVWWEGVISALTRSDRLRTSSIFISSLNGLQKRDESFLGWEQSDRDKVHGGKNKILTVVLISDVWRQLYSSCSYTSWRQTFTQHLVLSLNIKPLTVFLNSAASRRREHCWWWNTIQFQF